MEDSQEALASVESKLASVFLAETGQASETPEPTQVHAPQVLDAEPEPETAPPTVPEPEEPPVDSEGLPDDGQDRPRDEETGQFISKEEHERRLYAGRYSSVEELERAVEEKQSFIDRQANELGMLRRVERLEQQAQPAPQAQPSLPSNFEDLIDEDPAEAAEMAYNAGDQAALGQALRSWNEIYPGAPKLWAENKQMQEQLAEMRASTERTASESAYQAFSREHPDVDQYAGEMAEVAQQYPFLTETLRNGDARAQTEVLDFLYTKATGQKQARNTDTLAQAQNVADQERQALARQQKEQAAVASATKTVAPKKPLNEGQQMLQGIRDALVSVPDIRDGITTD